MKNPKRKKHNSPAITCCILVAMFFFTGCQLYQKATPLGPSAGNLSKSQYLNYPLSIHYYIILHHGEDCWHLKNLAPDSAVKSWSAEIETADPAFISFYYKTDGKRMPSYHTNEKPYLKQANVFPADSSMIFSPGKVDFNLSCAEIETLQTKRYAGVFVGLGAIVGLLIIAVSTFSVSAFSFDMGSGFTI